MVELAATRPNTVTIDSQPVITQYGKPNGWAFTNEPPDGALAYQEMLWSAVPACDALPPVSDPGD